MQKIKVKKLDSRAKIPTRNNETDAGLDLYAMEDVTLPSQFKIAWAAAKYIISKCIGGFSNIMELDLADTNVVTTKIPTGIAMSIPTGQYGRICDRSGLGSKAIKVFGGTIDSAYRGDITVCLMNFGLIDYHIKAGDRIAQIIIQEYKKSDLVEVDELEESERNSNGFGSSGR